MIKRSWTFTLTVPTWWNDLPNSIQAAEPLIFSRNGWKHISFIFIWPSNSSTLYSNANSNFIWVFFIKKLDTLTFAVSISILTTCFIYKEKRASNTSILYSFYLFIFIINNDLLTLALSILFLFYWLFILKWPFNTSIPYSFLFHLLVFLFNYYKNKMSKKTNKT